MLLSVWLALSFGLFALGLIFVPEAVAEFAAASFPQMRDSLVDGLKIFRAGLFGASFACLATGFVACNHRSSVPLLRIERKAWDLRFAALLLAVTALPLLPRLGDAFAYDEIQTMLLVERGILRILGTSNFANNHPFNSLLAWIMTVVAGPHPVAVRIPAFLFAVAVPQIWFWGCRMHGMAFRLSALVGLMSALHFSFAYHAVEARGYAFAMTSVSICCVLFPLILQSGRWILAVIYAVVAAIGVMSIATTIVVPFSHAVFATGCVGWSWWRQWRAGTLTCGDVIGLRCSSGPQGAGVAMVACLWVPILATMALSMVLPSFIAYLSEGALRDHPRVSGHILGLALVELTGVSSPVVATVYLLVAVVGVVMLRGHSLLVVSLAAPVCVQMLLLILPGATLSPRFLAYLVPVFSVGLAAFVFACWQARKWQFWVGFCCLVVWLGFNLRSLISLHSVGNPDLPRLSRNYDTPRTLITGYPVNMVSYYFKKAKIAEKDFGVLMPAQPGGLEGFDVVILSSALFDQHLRPVTVPWPSDAPPGFKFSEELPSWDLARSRYRVYVRGVGN